jgi:hypothetical protein
LLLEPHSKFVPASTAVSAEEARLYNLKIGSFSYRQIYADSKKELEALRAELPSFLEKF